MPQWSKERRELADRAHSCRSYDKAKGNGIPWQREIRIPHSKADSFLPTFGYRNISYMVTSLEEEVLLGPLGQCHASVGHQLELVWEFLVSSC